MLQSLSLLLLWVPGLGASWGRGGEPLAGTEQPGCAASERAPARCVRVCRATSSGHGPRSVPGAGDRSCPPASPPGSPLEQPARARQVCVGWAGEERLCPSRAKGTPRRGRWCPAGLARLPRAGSAGRAVPTPYRTSQPSRLDEPSEEGKVGRENLRSAVFFQAERFTCGTGRNSFHGALEGTTVS